MQQLLQTILTDPAARTDKASATIAASVAAKLDPWGSVDVQ